MRWLTPLSKYLGYIQTNSFIRSISINKISGQSLFKALFPEWKLILLWRSSLIIISFFHRWGGRDMLNWRSNDKDTQRIIRGRNSKEAHNGNRKKNTTTKTMIDVTLHKTIDRVMRLITKRFFNPNNVFITQNWHDITKKIAEQTNRLPVFRYARTITY